MPKVRPRRVRNLINLFVLLTLVISGILVASFFVFLRALRVLPPAFFLTIWMPVVFILLANLVAAIVNYFFLPKVIRPIEDLIRATDRVAKGDFSARVSSDHLVGEMKDLADSFNFMAEELGNTEIFRSDFMRDFSHEFKTPIHSMVGFARQLKNPDLSEEERAQYCDIIISESERLSNMSKNILLLSNYETQHIITEQAPYPLDEQIRDCVLLLEKEWEKKKIQLELNLVPITIRQNGEMLQHIWINLISNAVKFTPEGGTVSVSATENESMVFVTVKDNGIGMTEEEMKRIFDKCYQGDRSRSREGNGLGLCIVKRVCTLAGGSISVRSKPGKGSTFSVILPKGCEKD